MDYTNAIHNYIEKERQAIDSLDISIINEAMNLIMKRAKEGKTIFTMGNGGSSATASHFVCDFAKGIALCKDVPFKMICLSDNTPIVTAIANDIGYDSVFEFQLHDKVEKGDVVLAISGSGNSPNVINAVKYAKDHGATIIGLTGYSGGKLKELSDLNLHVPIDNMQIVEDVHMMFDHLMMYVLCNS